MNKHNAAFRELAAILVRYCKKQNTGPSLESLAEAIRTCAMGVTPEIDKKKDPDKQVRYERTWRNMWGRTYFTLSLSTRENRALSLTHYSFTVKRKTGLGSDFFLHRVMRGPEKEEWSSAPTGLATQLVALASEMIQEEPQREKGSEGRTKLFPKLVPFWPRGGVE